MEGETLLTESGAAKDLLAVKLVRPPLPLAERMRLRLRDRDAAQRAATTGYEVVEVFKGAGRFSKADSIDHPLPISAPVGTVQLLMSDPSDPSKWLVPRDLSDERKSFVLGALSLPVHREKMPLADRVRRLEHCSPFLGTRDSQIDSSVMKEFAAAPFEAVRAVAKSLDSSMVIAWIGDEEDPAARRLMFVLLGACGDKEDLPFVKRSIEELLVRGKAADLAPVLATLIALGGRDSLAEIDRRFFRPADVSSSHRRAAVEALRFHASISDSPIPRESVISSARLLLAHPDAADYVIGNLADWEDWQSMDQIVSIWDQHGARCTWLRTPILAYLEDCPRPEAKLAAEAITDSSF